MKESEKLIIATAGGFIFRKEADPNKICQEKLPDTKTEDVEKEKDERKKEVHILREKLNRITHSCDEYDT